MFKALRTAALSALVAFGAIAAMPASAQASGGGIYLGFGSGHGPSVGFHFGDAGHRGGPGYHRGGHCSPREAVRKASRMGLRNARVVRANNRSIHVQGRERGYGPTRVIFANARHCPVIR